MTSNHSLALATQDLTVGQRLRQRREELGLTLRDVASITKIQASHLAYLEEDRFSEFPAEVFARGFFRNYVRELRLDDGELLAAYEAQTGCGPISAVIEVAPVAPPAASVHRFTQPGTIGRVAYGVALAVFVVGLAVSVLVFGGDDSTRSAAYQAPGTSDSWQPVPADNDWRSYREN
ncbi:MAG: helix-turn-helix domain-containing protein [Myxococcales bacterium]|nr:helix-turn-helix domain-containing protein [Myxococcales bacterium]MCB9521092.1 helix-turn-helix domain-containing protein [Myxococcales bacterium]MCB9534199.1 helix-turn-helix domain-containing protein [Myxococcales bacterium]